MWAPLKNSWLRPWPNLYHFSQYDVKVTFWLQCVSWARVSKTFKSPKHWYRSTSVIFLPRSTVVAALVHLLATVVAPLTAQLGKVIQPSTSRFRWNVTVPDFLLEALTRSRTRARRGSSGGSQTTASTAIQASYVTLAITRRYVRLTTALAWCTIVSCIKTLHYRLKPSFSRYVQISD